jgi:hypothetical protein
MLTPLTLSYAHVVCACSMFMRLFHANDWHCVCLALLSRMFTDCVEEEAQLRCADLKAQYKMRM